MLYYIWLTETNDEAAYVSDKLILKLSEKNNAHITDFIYYLIVNILNEFDQRKAIEVFINNENLLRKKLSSLLFSDIQLCIALDYMETSEDTEKLGRKHLEECIRIREKEDKEGVYLARARLILAEILDDVEESEKIIREVMTYSGLKNNPDIVSECYMRLGELYFKEPNVAIDYFKQAIQMFDSYNNWNDYDTIAMCYNYLSDIYLSENQIELFEVNAKNAFEFCEKYRISGKQLLVSINAYVLSYPNNDEHVIELLTIAKDEICHNGLEADLSAAYVYNTAALTNNEKIFDRTFRDLELNAIDIFEYYGDSKSANIAKMNLISKDIEENNTSETENKLKEVERECSKRFSLQERIQLCDLYVEYYMKQKEYKLVKKHFEVKMKILEQSGRDCYFSLLKIFNCSYHILTKIYNREELKNMVKKVPNFVCRCYETLIELYDENLIVKSISEIEKFVRLIMLLDSEKFVTFTDKEIYEMISNTKALSVKALEDNLAIMRSDDDFEQYRLKKIKDNLQIEKDIYINKINSSNKKYEKRKTASVKYRWKSINEIFEDLPCNSVFIDYFCFLPKYKSEYYAEDMTFATFIIKTADNGVTCFKRIENLSRALARDYIHIILGEVKQKWFYNFADISKLGARMGLYENFAKPIEKYIDCKTKTLFIVPDAELCMIPYAVLGVDLFHTLCGKYGIVYIVSTCLELNSRKVDFNNKDAMILGNPKFSLTYYDEQPSLPNGAIITPLGFSNIEANFISKKFKCSAYTKKERQKVVY